MSVNAVCHVEVIFPSAAIVSYNKYLGRSRPTHTFDTRNEKAAQPLARNGMIFR